MEFAFRGGVEELSMQVRHSTNRGYEVTYVTYDVVCTDDFSAETHHSGAPAPPLLLILLQPLLLLILLLLLLLLL